MSGYIVAMDYPTCGKCGYELSGIAERGACPECGQQYDLDTGKGTHARTRPFVTRYIKTLSLVSLAGLIVLCSGGVTLFARNPLAIVFLGLVFAGVALIGAVASYLSERDA